MIVQLCDACRAIYGKDQSLQSDIKVTSVLNDEWCMHLCNNHAVIRGYITEQGSVAITSHAITERIKS